MPMAAMQAWTRDTIKPADWTVPLPPAALSELRAVLSELRRAPLPTFLLDPADFALDACRATMAEVRRVTQNGPMFAVLDRLPLAEMNRDEAIQLYWLLSSVATDSMTRPDRLPPTRYNLPNNERHILALHFSKNCIDWCMAGVVARGRSPNEGRHYASMAIDGEDLHVLSRSGDERAKNAHDGNLITFHTVKGFRELVYI